MRLKSVFLIFAFMLTSVVVAQEVEELCEFAYLVDGWARSTVEGAPNGAVFGYLANISSQEDTLIGVKSDIAEAVELHEVIMGTGDVMQMRPVEGGFVVPANGYLELKPGGLHIMLIGLRERLVAGETLDLVLNFEKVGEIALSVPIKDDTEAGMDMGDGEGMTSETPLNMLDAVMTTISVPPACAKIYVLGGWARSAGPGMPNSAAYGLLLNLTDKDEVLVTATTDVAEVVELHEMMMAEGDVMQMRPVEGGIGIPAGGTAVLQPSGYHVMLIGLKGELKAGDTMDMTLGFAENGEMMLTIPVQEPDQDDMGN